MILYPLMFRIVISLVVSAVGSSNLLGQPTVVAVLNSASFLAGPPLEERWRPRMSPASRP
jgi:hypothetical protein